MKEKWTRLWYISISNHKPRPTDDQDQVQIAALARADTCTIEKNISHLPSLYMSSQRGTLVRSIDLIQCLSRRCRPAAATFICDTGVGIGHVNCERHCLGMCEIPIVCQGF